MVLSDSDCDSGVDEDVKCTIDKEDTEGSPKSFKRSKKATKGLGLSRKEPTTSTNGNVSRLGGCCSCLSPSAVCSKDTALSFH